MSVSLPVLSLRDVRVRFGAVLALELDRLDFPSGPAALHFVMGPNGAGKTTLLNAVTGYAPMERGSRVVLHAPWERRLDGLGRSDVVRAGVARTFQAPPVFPSLTVRKSFELVARFAGAWAGRSALAEALLKELALERVADASLGSLPLPALRRAELGRCLAGGPRLLFLDEPTAGADSDEKELLADLLVVRINDLVSRLHRDGLFRHERLTCCVVTHDLAFVRRVDSALSGALLHLFDQGRLLALGPVEEVLGDDRVRRVYLGVA